MIERLQRAFEHIDKLSPEEQEEIAQIIEQRIEPLAVPPGSLAGAWSDMPGTFDEMLDALDRIRHESTPTSPMDEQLAWMDKKDAR